MSVPFNPTRNATAGSTAAPTTSNLTTTGQCAINAYTGTYYMRKEDATISDIVGDRLSGFRNRLINGNMAIDQRNAGATQTFTAGAALAYSVDRWYGYSSGANVTGARVQGASVGQFRYSFTGAASVTAIGFSQRIEQLNSADLAGSAATLSVDLANSLLTTVTWTAYYANTADTFGSLASPTRTQIATGTFTVTNTVTRYSANITVPSAATTGVEIVFTVGAQISGTWTIGAVQLEKGLVPTPFEVRSYGTELALCQRYFFVENGGGGSGFSYSSFGIGVVGSTTSATVTRQFPVPMRTAPPSITVSSVSGFIVDTGVSAVATTNLTLTAPTPLSARLVLTVAAGLIAGNAASLVNDNSGKLIT